MAKKRAKAKFGTPTGNRSMFEMLLLLSLPLYSLDILKILKCIQVNLPAVKIISLKKQPSR